MTRDLATCREALARFDRIEDPKRVQQLSRDFYWYSPILRPQLQNICADLVVSPRNEAEVIEILSLCHQSNVPVTVRGAGTGNYGQAMPLQGGVVLHTKHMNGILAVTSDHLIAEPGAIISDIEKAARANSMELRLFPSTTAIATLGGFIAGGSSGIGAIRWGGLRNSDNIRRLRLITMEATPRILELRGRDIAMAAHAYGVNGVITQIEIPVDRAVDWVEVLIATPNLASANRLAFQLGEDPRITLRMLSSFDACIPRRYFSRHRQFLRDDEALTAIIVARDSLEALENLLAGTPDTATGNSQDSKIAIRFRSDRDGKGMRLPHLYELAWNHTTLRAMKVDPDLTYLQMILPRAESSAQISRITQKFADELILHFEFTRFGDKIAAVALPLLRFSTAARLYEVIRILEENFGATIFNPHCITLEEGGMKRTDMAQLDFKRQTDPKGLLNPGKMIAWDNPEWQAAPGRTFLFNH
jgi:FAD/FMN-containing dehydrogenase